MLDLDNRVERTLGNFTGTALILLSTTGLMLGSIYHHKTLGNICSQTLWGTEAEYNFHGLEVDDLHTSFCESGNALNVDDAREWLRDDGGYPEYHFISDNQYK